MIPIAHSKSVTHGCGYWTGGGGGEMVVDANNN